MANKSNERAQTAYVEKLEDKSVNVIVDFEGDLFRVLSLCASAVAKPVANETETTANGTVCVEFVYLNEKNELLNGKAIKEFKTKISDDVSQDMKVETSILEASVLDVSSNGAKFSIDISLTPFEVRKEEVDYFSETQDGIETKKVDLQKTIFIGSGEKLLSKTDIIENSNNVSKVLDKKVFALCKKVTSGSGYVKIEGDVYIQLVVANQKNDEVVFQNLKQISPFSEEIEIEGAQDKSLCFAQAKVIDVSDQIVEENNIKRVEITYDLKIMVDVFEKENFVATSDAYSLTNETFITTGTYKYQDSCLFESGIDKLESSIIIDSELPRIDKLLFYTNQNTNILNSYIENNEVVLTGLTNVEIIYFNDEQNEIKSYEAKIPFEIKHKFDEDIASDDIIFANVEIGDIDVSARRGREIYIDGKIVYNITVCKTKNEAVVQEINKGDVLEKNQCPIRIYFASKGQSVWEVAKNLHEDVNLISSQNQNIEDVFLEDKKIVIYRQRTV